MKPNFTFGITFVSKICASAKHTVKLKNQGLLCDRCKVHSWVR